MVLSSTSCFKIIACGSRPSEGDDFEGSESRNVEDKRGWSFRKKSTRQRVLSSNANTEYCGGTVESSGFPVISGKNTGGNCTNPGEMSTLGQQEAPCLAMVSSDKSASMSPAVEVNCTALQASTALQEHVVFIQTAIRHYLARHALRKLKSIVKLQAAVRGHLVRRHAVGTLRCVQAIVKMQALVRARQRKHSFLERSTTIEKLLANEFARQLLDSSSSSRAMHFKCDPLRPNSAWRWLERWMAVSVPAVLQLPKDKFSHTNDEQTMLTFLKAEAKDICNLGNRIPDNGAEVLVGSTRSPVSKFACDEKLNFPVKMMDKENCSQRAQADVVDVSIQASGAVLGSQLTQVQGSVSCKSDVDRENLKQNSKRAASEQLGVDGKRFMFGSRRSSNPAFAAVQSKFEQLSSNVSAGRSLATCQDSGVDSNIESFISKVDSSDANNINSRAMVSSELHDFSISIEGSECGTELSVTSALDSPDKFEAGTGEPLDKKKPMTNLDNASKTVSEMLAPSVLKDEHKEVVPIYSVQDNSEAILSGRQTHTGDVICQTKEKLSQYGSPSSHFTVPDSEQGTPSSQLSVKAEGTRSDQSKPKQKLQGLRHVENPRNTSTSSATELKDVRNGKRRKSFDHDSRTSSTNAIPSYMQATESARAKVHSHFSPKSSPEVQEKDIYVRKRHSFPATSAKQESTSGKQGSPRMQRSSSQAQQNTKGNGAHLPDTGGKKKLISASA